MANLFPTPFPADLPENWTQGQTVSPNGTEVGLTQQYGYNHLMQLVNSLASGLNGVNANTLLTALGTIPVANGGTGETNLDKFLFVKGVPEEVNTLLNLLTTGIYNVYQGNTKFTDWPAEIGNTNVYGVLEVQKNGVYVTQRLILTNGNTVGTEIWVRFINSSSMRTTSWNEVVTSENLTSLIQSALENGGINVVKSVQRGVMTIEAENKQATATISEVNPNKSLVIYTGCVTGNNTSYLPMLVLTANDTVTATRLSSGDSYGTSVPYQVIEFY